MRAALIAMFGLFGMSTTSWLGRLPSIRADLQLTDGQVGRLIVMGAIGGILAVIGSGALIPRIGSRRTLWLATIGNLVGMSAVSLGIAIGSLPLFGAGLAINGMATPLNKTTIVLEGAKLEKVLGRAILPPIHAAFPVGAALGAGLAALTSLTGVAAALHIIGITLVGAAIRVWLIKPGTALPDSAPPLRHLADKPRSPLAKKPRSPVLAAWTERRTLLIGLMMFAASMSEASASNWLNLAVVDSFHIREAIGALAYGTFVAAMLVTRVSGAWLIGRFGRVKVMYASTSTALAGLLLFGLAPALPLAWAGIAFWGLGAALAWPICNSAAADDPAKAPARVSVASSFSSIGMLGVPPLLGLLVDSWGVRHALLIIAVAMVVSLIATRTVRPETTAKPIPDSFPTGSRLDTPTERQPDQVVPTASDLDAELSDLLASETELARA